MGQPVRLPSVSAPPKLRLVWRAERPSRAVLLRSLPLIVGVGFVLRVAVILAARTYHVRPLEMLTGIPYFSFGAESGSIAASLASSGFSSFANPFGGHTGPTAWLAPAYPFLTALVFKLFGIYTNTSAFVVLTLNSLFSALTCIPVYYLARKVGDRTTVLWAAWAWALLPAAMYWAIKWAWDTSLSAFLFTAALLLTLRLARKQRARWWALWGGVWGLLALTNPACCLVLPVCGVWLCSVSLRQWRKCVPLVLLSALVFFVVITPWEIRNYVTFHQLMPIRDNLWVEMRMGNGPGANGLWLSWAHPTQNPSQLAAYKRAGETAFIAQKRAEALHFIRENPVRFLRISGVRVIYFWAGTPKAARNGALGILKNWFVIVESVLSLGGLLLLLKRKHRFAGVLAAVCVLYPAIYYVTFTDQRYRHPLEPLLVLLSIYLISQCREANSKWSQKLADRH